MFNNKKQKIYVKWRLNINDEKSFGCAKKCCGTLYTNPEASADKLKTYLTLNNSIII